MIKLKSRPLMAVILALLAFVTVGCWTRSKGPTIQGWTEADRAGWYWQSQGSRLLPYKWFVALEQPGTEAKFSDETFLTSFGHLAAPPGRKDRLPIGFAIDQQADQDFVVTKLRWYAGQRGDSAEKAEPWIGLNCAACHTAELRYQGRPIRVDGGPGFSDLQSFVASLDRALVETRKDTEKFDRFAREVLPTDDEHNRALLRAALDSLIAWQRQAQQLSHTPLRYGYARLDAFGHIFNKIEMLGGAAQLAGNPADAPVSFPFLWGIHQHERVQWNGLAKNIQIPLPGGGNFDIGALGRNTAEALGVFAEVVVTPADPTPAIDFLKGNGPFSGYVSSINVDNIEWFESVLTKLESPKWSANFPGIDQKKIKKGEQLFSEHCARCHKTPDRQEKGKPTEVMEPIARTAEQDAQSNEKNLTDIWMACNVFTRVGRSGKLEGTKEDYFTASASSPVLGKTDQLAMILGVASRGALVGKKGEIARTAAASFFGIRRWQWFSLDDPSADILSEKGQRALRRRECTRTASDILAYKARPLDGIWATAPYLHNGSVPTLYHLLLPAKDRPRTFWIGSREYDPKHVGFVWDRKIGPTDFEFKAADANGEPVDGNANIGHEYGITKLTEDADRWALVEYLKTL